MQIDLSKAMLQEAVEERNRLQSEYRDANDRVTHLARKVQEINRVVAFVQGKLGDDAPTSEPLPDLPALKRLISERHGESSNQQGPSHPCGRPEP